MWVSSRDERRLVSFNPETEAVHEETPTAGIGWAAVAVGDALYLTVGEGAEDDRYLRRYLPGRGFDDSFRVALPELTGSYLSHDGESFYLSQWYKHRVLRLAPDGSISRIIDIGAEISGHFIVNSQLYVLRGTEQDGENWHLARLDLDEETPRVEDLAQVPFGCRSLAFDGSHLWTNDRANNEIVRMESPSPSGA